MLDSNRHHLALAGCCLVFVLLILIAPTRAQAHAVKSGLALQAKAGFETRYRDENWVPVQVTLHNTGPDFSGTLSLSASSSQYLGQSNPSTPSNYQMPISLANGAQKQVTMYVPLYFDAQSVAVNLLDGSGNVIGSQSAVLNPLSPGEVFVGILSDQSSGFGPLSSTPLPDQTGSVAINFLNASTMPTVAAALKNFDAIVLDNFTTANLSAAQLAALQTWVNQGGILMLAGGPEWNRTLGSLPRGLLPVTLNGTTTIPPGTSLLPLGGPRAGHAGQNNVPDTVQFPVTISTATLAQGGTGKSEVVLASRTAPLIVQADQGQGTILYLAFDPTLEPVLGWQGAGVLWEGLLLRSMGDRLLAHYGGYAGASNSVPEQPLLAYRMSTLLQSLLPGTIPFPWWTLGILLAGYILALGPLRLVLLRLLKRRDWSWRIVLCSIVVFSLLSYGFAYKEKGTSILSDSITIAQLGQNGSPTAVTTYVGVFVPNEGNFQIHVSGDGLVQPSPDNLPSFQGQPINPTAESPATVAPAQNGKNVNLQDVTIWTLHAILSQQDRQVHKGLISELTIQNGSLVGTVTNTLGYALSDTFVLTHNDAFGLGKLAAGETKHIRFKLSSIPLAANSALADLIALNTNSPDYSTLPAQPQNPWQRHLAMLYALDGEGFYGSPYSSSLPCTSQCNPLLPLLPAPLGINPVTTSSGTTPGNIPPTPGWEFTSTRVTDPLLVPGSAATLIGWAENPLDASDNVTINNINPAGVHETLIQAPLTVNLAGSLNLPPNFIEGQLIDTAGSGIELRYPGVYVMSIGSMTFEYTVPGMTNLRISGLTITEPPDINAEAGVGSFVDTNSLPFRLYNWHSSSWDTFLLNQETFTTKNVSAYIGPGGRVLVQFANEDSSLGTFAVGKPSLNLQGVALGSPPANT